MKALPFTNLQSRLASAIILSYVDFQEEVMLIVLRLSHGSRAYLHNAGGLKGFFVQEPLVKIIIREGIENANRWQNCQNLRKELRARYSLTLEGRIRFLKENYPAAALMVLKNMGRD